MINISYEYYYLKLLWTK